MKKISGGNKLTGQYIVAGLMSGTSLDGLDIAFCSFSLNKKWDYKILAAETIPYSEEWTDRLKSAHLLIGKDLLALHNQYGQYLGKCIVDAIEKSGIKPELISSHGHTIFHQPNQKLTFQLGSGASIAAATGINTVCDFRTFDVALGGQGAPLVPVGDELLFGEYDACLNLGGFSNISYKNNGQRIACDICPVNIILNYLALKKGFTFDKNGQLGKTGMINTNLLDSLNQLDYYRQEPPKSLGREWLETQFIPLLQKSGISVDDQMRTVYEHIAVQIVKNLNHNRVLITGGGAHNTFLMEILQKKSGNKFIIPDDYIIDYKEALVFAFLGLLRMLEKPNCLSSVTGCQTNHTGGIIYKIS